jgi:hypothetical protein
VVWVIMDCDTARPAESGDPAEELGSGHPPSHRRFLSHPQGLRQSITGRQELFRAGCELELSGGHIAVAAERPPFVESPIPPTVFIACQSLDSRNGNPKSTSWPPLSL